MGEDAAQCTYLTLHHPTYQRLFRQLSICTADICLAIAIEVAKCPVVTLYKALERSNEATLQ